MLPVTSLAQQCGSGQRCSHRTQANAPPPSPFTGPWTVPRSSVSRAASGHCPPTIGRQPRPPRGPSGPQASDPQHNPQQPASRELRWNRASQTTGTFSHHPKGAGAGERVPLLKKFNVSSVWKVHFAKGMTHSLVKGHCGTANAVPRAGGANLHRGRPSWACAL